jgi:diaminobutyrate-2-oxoglutarate transaminase
MMCVFTSRVPNRPPRSVITQVNIASSATSAMVDPTDSAESPFTVFEQYESEVRSYCRSFPALFHRAKDSELFDDQGGRWIDFLAGAGALSYGHNPEPLKKALLDYLRADGLTSGLDLYTTAKAAFLETFADKVLTPRHLPYRVQFTGPTGTNAVEAALKLARKVTGRPNVIAFMGGYHGHSLGALAATANRDHRNAAGLPLDGVVLVPFPDQRIAGLDSLAYLETLLSDSHSGVDLPAAIMLETVQAEGGIYVAPPEFLRGLRQLCDRYGIVLIVDDIQVGCGRTGPFFSFESAGIVPDLVTLSKSISGYGLPMAVLLIRDALDIWKPAEHTGTFRGNQLAFVTGTAALHMREDIRLEDKVAADANFVDLTLRTGIGALDERIVVRGTGMIWGVDFAGIDASGALARQIARASFDAGLIIERVGRNDTVLKILPPLTIARPLLSEGCSILEHATKVALESWTN